MSTMGSFPKRKQCNEPLLTATEMAEQLGVSMQSMLRYMRYHNGPTHEIVSKGNSTTKTYFKPSEVRKWWNQLKSNRNE